MAETSANDKRPRPARRLSDLTAATLKGSFAKRGFASAEIITRWAEIAGEDIARHSEPLRLQWPNGTAEPPEPATLVLRVEGPAALEIQHMSGVIIERLNRFFGWPAVGRIALRQAPLRPKPVRERPAPPDPEAVAAARAALPPGTDAGLSEALARLQVAVKRK